MLSEKTNSFIGEFLLRIARTEKKLEVIRQMLCEFPQFEPYSAFQRLDRSSNNVLSSKDIFSFLQVNQQTSFNEEQIKKTFLDHYDFDGDGFLCFAEFLRAILPADQPVLRTMVSQRPVYTVDETLDDEIEYTLTKLITEEINSYFELEDIKTQIASFKDFSCEDLLEQIDFTNLGYIDFNNLFEFFRINAFYPYEEEIIAVLRRLDKNDDGRLALPELFEAFKPKSLSSKKTPSTNTLSSQKKPSKPENDDRSSQKKTSKSEIPPISQRKPSHDYYNKESTSSSQKKSYLENPNTRQTLSKPEKTIEEQLESLNKRILSDKKPSYKKEDPTERKSRIKEPLLELTEKKLEPARKSSLHQEIILKNEQKLQEYEENPLSQRKTNLGSTYTNTPPKYPRPAATKGTSSQISERTPPHYSLYPYEPVRRAFSPMKDQIIRSSKTPPKKKDSSLKESENSNKRISFQPDEEDLGSNIKYNERVRLSLYQKEIPEKKSSIIQEKKPSIIREKNDLKEKVATNEDNRRISQKKWDSYETKPERQFLYQEENHKQQDEGEGEINEENQEIYEEIQENNQKRSSDHIKRPSNETSNDIYQSKPLISSENKRLSAQNQEKRISLQPQDPFLDKKLSQRESLIKNEPVSNKKPSKPQQYQEKPQVSYSEDKKPSKDSIYREKPLVFSEDKRASMASSKKDDKTPNFNEKRTSNMENSERSVDFLQEKARLQSIKIDEILNNEKKNISDKKPGYRGSDLGFYTKNECFPLKTTERKSAPLILAHTSFNSIKNEENNDSIPINTRKSKVNRELNENLQVKEEINEEEDENIIKQGNNNEENQREILLDIIKYFKTLLNCEEELEKCKQDLALRPDFNLVDFFLFFDKEKLGCCVKEEFGETLKELGVNFQNVDLGLFLKRFSKNEETLKFYDFSEAFLPMLDDYADLLNQRKPINIDFQFKYRELFSPETRRLIAETIKTHLENEECLEAIREAIARKDQNIDWEMYFDSFDMNKDGFISDNEFCDFMEENNLIFTRKELEMVYERVDLDKDGKISQQEFRRELQPRLDYSI